MKAKYFERCQVATPTDVVKLVWKLALKSRGGRPFKSVIDLGAGDARFAIIKNAYQNYLGIERDAEKLNALTLPKRAKVICADAMKWDGPKKSLAIGNPPYIRHAYLDPSWRDEIRDRIREECGVSMKGTANLFILFLMKALLCTAKNGLVVQLIPFEWVTRPNALEVREYIKSKGWAVSVYRFDTDIFPSVLTTASITIIDKSKTSESWTFGEIGRDGNIKITNHPSGQTSKVIPHERRDSKLFAFRGLSPGGQDIFVLTEKQRLAHSLRKGRDVAACVTSLRNVGMDVKHLSKKVFEKEFVNNDRPCWLIRSDREKLSPQLAAYLKSCGKRWEKYSTCTERKIWWKYVVFPVPNVLISSGFVGRSPKVVTNAAGAIGVGSVYGIISTGDARPRAIAKALGDYDFQRRLVHHANNLKKIEVKQLNWVLKQLFS